MAGGVRENSDGYDGSLIGGRVGGGVSTRNSLANSFRISRMFVDFPFTLKVLERRWLTSSLAAYLRFEGSIRVEGDPVLAISGSFEMMMAWIT